MKRTTRLLLIVLSAATTLATLAAPAEASQLIARDARSVRLEVDTHGRALISYRSAEKADHVLAWGAVNAIAPTRMREQVRFHVDYSGGWASNGRDVWRTFRNACRPAHVRLAWLVTACRARDGSYWALQTWQRTLPNYGLPAAGIRGAWELRLSHGKGRHPGRTTRCTTARRTRSSFRCSAPTHAVGRAEQEKPSTEGAAAPTM